MVKRLVSNTSDFGFESQGRYMCEYYEGDACNHMNGDTICPSKGDTSTEAGCNVNLLEDEDWWNDD